MAIEYEILVMGAALGAKIVRDEITYRKNGNGKAYSTLTESHSRLEHALTELAKRFEQHDRGEAGFQSKIVTLMDEQRRLLGVVADRMR